MSTETKEFTFQDVAEHNTKSDAYMVIHDKVYDCSKFIDEHPYVFLPYPSRLRQRRNCLPACVATTRS